MRQHESPLIVMRLELLIHSVPANQAPSVLQRSFFRLEIGRKANPHMSKVAPLNLSFAVSMTIVISLLPDSQSVAPASQSQRYTRPLDA